MRRFLKYFRSTEISNKETGFIRVIFLLLCPGTPKTRRAFAGPDLRVNRVGCTAHRPPQIKGPIVGSGELLFFLCLFTHHLLFFFLLICLFSAQQRGHQIFSIRAAHNRTINSIQEPPHTRTRPPERPNCPIFIEKLG